jgi:hypothetical protein
MKSKKKRLARPPRSSREAPARAVEREHEQHMHASYPTVREVLERADMRGLVASALRAAAASGVVFLGVAASGCADPVCASSSLDEARVHSEAAARNLVGLELRASFDEAKIGLGIVPHPVTPLVAGEMPAVMPSTPYVPPPVVATPEEKLTGG